LVIIIVYEDDDDNEDDGDDDVIKLFINQNVKLMKCLRHVSSIQNLLIFYIIVIIIIFILYIYIYDIAAYGDFIGGTSEQLMFLLLNVVKMTMMSLNVHQELLLRQRPMRRELIGGLQMT
jgi:hypothetical protein